MLSILSRIFFFTALALALLPAGTQAAGHFPDLVPSSYFVLPGQSLTISASGFPQNETLRIVASGSEVVSLRPGAASSLTFTVPFRTDSLTASGSGVSRRITVGRYYPVVEPDAYFVPRGGQVSFHGRGFAPGERVAVSLGTEEIGRALAAKSGGMVAGPFGLPQAGGDYTFGFRGLSSGASHSVRVHVADHDPWIVLSEYYAARGALLTVRGSAFGADESVEVRFGGMRMGAARTDGEGNFSFTFLVPGGGPGEKLIRARGLLSGLAAEARFTQAE